MLPFAAFQKGWFSEVLKTLQRGPWGLGEVKMGNSPKIFEGLHQTLPMTPHMPPFTSFKKVGFGRSRGPFGRNPGDLVWSKQFFFKVFDGLHQTLQKSQFSEVSGTLRQGPWGPGEFETENFFKKFDGLHQMLPMTPFAVFKKSRFSEVSGTLREGPWGPPEGETAKKFKILNGLDQTL